MYTDVSDEFLEAQNGAEPNYCFKMDFGGDVIVDDVFSVSYSGGSCGDRVVPGGTVISNIKVELSVLPSSVRKGNSCTVYFGINGEYIPCNIFNLTKIEKNGERLNLSFEDNMAKTEKGYFSSLSYPSTTLKMLSEIAKKCGVSFDTSGLTAITIKEKPEGYTCREIIGYIAGLYGKFAVCNRSGKIAFKWYNTANPVQLSEYCYDTPTIDTDNTVIGRVVCNGYSSGNGTAIDYDCIFMTQAQLETVYASLDGFTYRTGTLTLRLGNILVDAWDTVSINYGGETIILPAGVITMKYNGGISMEINAPSQEISADEESYKSPAAKQMERLVAQLLSAEQAIIKKASIEELNASIANLENVYAAKADVKDLTTQVATIEKAYIGKADVEQLYAKKAEIDSLVATSASFTTIDSKVANINNLLAGNAGTGTLTTIKLTAENAEIATALIKDLTAANFRSKTIETDDFIIKSSSGKLQIVGNTIQIKDTNNTVRVQIGEDGKSDYGIYVCDASGKIMFTSYDGLHADGIKSGIIKNDMVADDAHISGSKLDISSIIDGINNDSTYLKSSRVIIDGTEQTINAKFTELTTSIDGIGTRTSTLESDLSGFRTTVSETYATKSTLNSSVDTLTTQYSILVQDITEFKTTVSKTYTTKEAFDGLEIGSRNIATGTASMVIGSGKWEKGHWRSSGTGSIESIDITDSPISGVDKGAKLTASTAGKQIGIAQDLIPLNNNNTYTLSCWVRGSSAGLTCRLQPFYASSSDTGGVGTFTLTGEWQYISYTTIRSPLNTSNYSGGYVYLIPSATGDTMEICGIKLEKGNKATDWSPAPEDTEASITAVETIATQNADKLNWIVKSGTSATDFTLTDRTATLISNYINLNGLVTFSGLGSDAVNTIKGYSTEAVNNLEIGGVNLLLNTKLFATASSTSLRGALLSGLPISDGIYYRGFAIRGNTITASITEVCRYYFTDFSLGDTFTFSFCAKGDVAELRAFFYGASGYVQVAKCNNSQGENNTNVDGRCSFTIDDDWKRYWVTWTLKSTGDTSIPKYVMLRTNDATSGQTVYVCGCKLEKGNKITDWTPAPEDVETEISDASIVNWCYNNNKTYIDGAKIYTGTITADKISAMSLSAITANLGTVTAGIIQSNGYVSGTNGMKISLDSGTFETIETDSTTASKKIVITNANIKFSYSDPPNAIEELEGYIGLETFSKTLGGISISASSGIVCINDSAIFSNDSLTIPYGSGIYFSGSTSFSKGIRMLSVTSNGSFHIGNAISNGATRLISGTDNTIEFYRPESTDNIKAMATIKYLNSISRLYMPNQMDIGTDASHACIRQRTTGVSTLNYIYVGNSSQPLSFYGTTITASKSITTSSDSRVKNHIDSLPKGSENLFDYLDGKSFLYNDSVSTQKSYGFIAQDVLSALTSAGLTTDDFAGFCDINGDGTQYALAYEQFIPIMWNEIKRLRKALSERS